VVAKISTAQQQLLLVHKVQRQRTLPTCAAHSAGRLAMRTDNPANLAWVFGANILMTNGLSGIVRSSPENKTLFP